MTAVRASQEVEGGLWCGVVVGSCVLIIDKKLQKSSSSNKQYGQFTQTGRWTADRITQALPARPEALSCVSCEEMSFSPWENHVGRHVGGGRGELKSPWRGFNPVCLFREKMKAQYWRCEETPRVAATGSFSLRWPDFDLNDGIFFFVPHSHSFPLALPPLLADLAVLFPFELPLPTIYTFLSAGRRPAATNTPHPHPPSSFSCTFP